MVHAFFAWAGLGLAFRAGFFLVADAALVPFGFARGRFWGAALRALDALAGGFFAAFRPAFFCGADGNGERDFALCFSASSRAPSKSM